MCLLYLTSLCSCSVILIFCYAEGFLAFYDSSTFNGSSGSPVVKVVDGKLQVVGLHRFRAINEKCRAGTIFGEILRHACFIDGEGMFELVKCDEVWMHSVYTYHVTHLSCV